MLTIALSNTTKRHIMPEHKEEVAILGIAGLYPESNNINELSDLLFNKINGEKIDL